MKAPLEGTTFLAHLRGLGIIPEDLDVRSARVTATSGGGVDVELRYTVAQVNAVAVEMPDGQAEEDVKRGAPVREAPGPLYHERKR